MGKNKKKPRRKRAKAKKALEEQHYDDDDDAVNDECIELYDRVWYLKDNRYQRGVVKQRSDPSSAEEAIEYQILPTDAPDGSSFDIRHSGDCIHRDHHAWQLRFKVGDDVVCYAQVKDVGLYDTTRSRRWLPATVTKVWVTDDQEQRHVWPYECEIDGDVARDYLSDMREWIHLNRQLIIADHDEFIIDTYTNCFSEGREVIFNSELAMNLKHNPHRPKWVEGTVEKVETWGRMDFCAAYKISFGERNKLKTCLVPVNNDEHIALVDTPYRKRLLDSIKQACTYDHIDSLIADSGIDFGSFQDLLIAKAIEYGSYDALLWLQENSSFDFDLVCDAEGNGFLHQIVKGAFATRFFERAANSGKNDKELDLGYKFGENIYGNKTDVSQCNKQGQTILHMVVAAQDKCLLQVIFSSRVYEKLALNFFWQQNEKCLSDLHEIARLLPDQDILKMLDEVDAYTTLNRFRLYLAYSYKDTAKPDLSRFGAESLLSVARRLVRMACKADEEDRTYVMNRIISSLAEKGEHHFLPYLLQASPNLMSNKYGILLSSDQNEFNQIKYPSFVGNGECRVDLYQHMKVDLVSLVANGKGQRKSADEIDQLTYQRYLARFLCAAENDAPCLDAFLEDALKGIVKSYGKALIEHKIFLLRDDETYSNRMVLLNYLVRDQGLSPPNFIEMVQWRKCGVLRWLVQESLLDLQKLAYTDGHIIQRKAHVTFFGSRHIPKTLTIGEFLIFAAVEFDDLQTIQWLVKFQCIPAEKMICYGWNLFHACAYYGRTEIAHWLVTEANMKLLVQVVSRRKPWDHYFAAHLAVEQGFTKLADLFLSWGCPVKDQKGRPIEMLAEKSKFPYVIEWSQEKAKTSILNKDIQKLLNLLSGGTAGTESVKKFITKSKCLDFEMWQSSGYFSAEDLGPLGMTLLQVVKACCNFGDTDFIIWLFTVALITGDSYSLEEFWGTEHFITKQKKFDWIGLAQELEDEILLSFIGIHWVQELKCTDPIDKGPLKNVFTLCQDDQAILKDLLQARNGLLKQEVLAQIVNKGQNLIKKLLSRGETVQAITTTWQTVKHAALEVSKYDRSDFEDHFEYGPILSNGKLRIDCALFMSWEQNPITWQLLYKSAAPCESDRAYLVFASEGYAELISWSLINGEGWDAEKELEVTRIAAYRAHSEVVDIFLCREVELKFQSSTPMRYYAAILGAAESGRVEDLATYFSKVGAQGISLDPICILDNTFENEEHVDYDEKHRKNLEVISHCFFSVAVFGCLTSSDDPRLLEPVCLPNMAGYALLKWVAANANVSPKMILKSAALIIGELLYGFEAIDRTCYLLRFLFNEMELNAWLCYEDIIEICRKVLSYASFEDKNILETRDAVMRLLELVSSLGLDIQSLRVEQSYREKRTNKLEVALEELQSDQQQHWSKFDIVKQQGSLEAIQSAIKEKTINLGWYDKHGLQLVHLVAAYDRLDVLKWLIKKKLACLEDVDGSGRSVLAVAEASNSLTCVNWIRRQNASNMIASLVISWFRCKDDMKQKETILCIVVLMQARFRGYLARRIHRRRVLKLLEASQRFRIIWGRVMLERTSNDLATWATLKQQQCDIGSTTGTFDESDIFDTVEVLGEAGRCVLVESDESKEDLNDEIGQLEVDFDACSLKQAEKPETTPTEHFDQIQLTREVIKWLRVGDSKYRQFFIRRMKQLAAGDRSRILAKRLSGSKTLIYETYLEQKSGFRILWTESPDKQSLLIWYVAKHKAVSRLVNLIDNAQSRCSRQLLLALTHLEEGDKNSSTEVEATKMVMLDPRSDTPLKLYNVYTDEINRLADNTWEPPLHLTPEEKDIVETEGSVLVLGRSGTGKTVCICNRMHRDCHRAKDNTCFSQLFVARSDQLCKYVEKMVTLCDLQPNSTSNRKFTKFACLIQSLESTLPEVDNKKHLFLSSGRIDFLRFKRDLWKPSMGIDSLIAWTSIRSFIKGSIEAVQRGRPLNEEEYLKLGKKRCRLTMEQRKLVYSLFLKYEKFIQDSQLWDDCDRISALLMSLVHTQTAVPFLHQQVCYSKIYVDEIQDYTQAEIALFFRLCGPGGLFLAGDPAQSVVKGVEFRFEEVRSVGHYLYEKDRKLIPDKPKIVSVNFRSHSGILNVAAGILDQLFGAFPDAAKQLKKDKGLFTGPRPSVLYRVEIGCLKELVSKLQGVVILTHDDACSNVKHQLGYPLVSGIREAKGLEFQTVIVLDFFRRLPVLLGKWFRDLFLRREVHDIGKNCPELEGYLKLFYTGITRCVQRLFFVETTKSTAGDGFVRWVTSTKNAVSQQVDDIERMARTPDEWRTAGLDNAIMAENAIDAKETESWLEKATYCFDQGLEAILAKKARAHKASACFRSHLDSTELHTEAQVQDLECKAALVIESLLAEGLLFESRRVISVVLPYFSEYTQTMLKKHLVSKLPSTEV